MHPETTDYTIPETPDQQRMRQRAELTLSETRQSDIAHTLADNVLTLLGQVASLTRALDTANVQYGELRRRVRAAIAD